MRLSKRGEYGLRAMIALAEPAEKSDAPQMMQIKEISLREQISAKFLEQILLTLKNAGLLHSKMGVGGGVSSRGACRNAIPVVFTGAVVCCS